MVAWHSTCLQDVRSATSRRRRPETIIVDDFDARVVAMAGRGLKPATREVYDNNVRKLSR